jgi:hypothetical protein
MLTEAISGPRAWVAASVDDCAAWYFSLPGDLVAALDMAIQELRRHPRLVTSLQVRDFPCGALGESLRPVRECLASGRGFVIVDGIPREGYSPGEMQAIYWLVGQLLGRPMAQNVEGTLLYDVRDTGQELALGARFSVTSYESSFHTDNSFGETVLDTVGLLCLSGARSGGLSQVVSGYAVHNRLLAEHGNDLPILYQPFHVDRRGGLRAGEAPTISTPIFQWEGGELTIRYLRTWIKAGHDKKGRPLTSAQVKALDVLDSVLGQRDLAADFMLQPGQMLFTNNRWIFHNRTAFEDWPQVERRRHYVRLWLQTR